MQVGMGLVGRLLSDVAACHSRVTSDQKRTFTRVRSIAYEGVHVALIGEEYASNRRRVKALQETGKLARFGWLVGRALVSKMKSC
jgi:hypothetical protein